MKYAKRTLSSPLTFFWKFAAAPLLVVFFLAAVGVERWKGRTGTAESAGMTAVGILSLIFVAAWLVWLTARLKRVVIKDGALYVSNYRTEIRVPFSEIRDVRETSDLRWFVLRVDLRNPTIFGQHIEFRPRLQLSWSHPHPIVRELLHCSQHAEDCREISCNVF